MKPSPHARKRTMVARTVTAAALTVVCTAALGAGASQPAAAVTLDTVPAESADALVDAIGVNVHHNKDYMDSATTGGFSKVVTKLQELGIRHVRMGRVDIPTDPPGTPKPCYFPTTTPAVTDSPAQQALLARQLGASTVDGKRLTALVVADDYGYGTPPQAVQRARGGAECPAWKGSNATSLPIDAVEPANEPQATFLPGACVPDGWPCQTPAEEAHSSYLYTAGACPEPWKSSTRTTSCQYIGANETDLGLSETRLQATSTWNATKSQLPNAALLQSSIANKDKPGWYTTLGAPGTAGVKGNIHLYPAGLEPLRQKRTCPGPCLSLSGALKEEYPDPPNPPVLEPGAQTWATEFGYHEFAAQTDGHQSTPADVAALYTARAPFTMTHTGALPGKAADSPLKYTLENGKLSRLYYYELSDEPITKGPKKNAQGVVIDPGVYDTTHTGHLGLYCPTFDLTDKCVEYDSTKPGATPIPGMTPGIKRTGIALKSLIGIFKDPAAPSSFTPASIQMSVTSPGYTGAKTEYNEGGQAVKYALYQKSNGNYLLALWRDAVLYDRGTKTVVDPGVVTATVTFATKQHNIETYVPGQAVYEDENGATHTRYPASGSSLTWNVDVKGTPKIIEFAYCTDVNGCP